MPWVVWAVPGKSNVAAAAFIGIATPAVLVAGGAGALQHVGVFALWALGIIFYYLLQVGALFKYGAAVPGMCIELLLQVFTGSGQFLMLRVQFPRFYQAFGPFAEIPDQFDQLPFVCFQVRLLHIVVC